MPTDPSTTAHDPTCSVGSEPFVSLPQLVALRAQREPDRPGLTALGRSGDPTDALSVGELDLRARALASRLGGVTAAGDRVLVPAMPGLRFHSAFLACLYAGMIAVPVPAVRANALRKGDDPRRHLARLAAIAADAEPAALVLPAEQLPAVADLVAAHPTLSALRLVAADPGTDATTGADGDPEILPGPVELGPEDVAFLQYTSGSTSAPRGVVVTHGALVANQREIRHHLDLEPTTLMVSWLPTYHDMGLCAGLLQPLHVGAQAVVLEPETFLVRPERWLQALSHRSDVVSAAPDFAYALCAARVSDEVLAGLDLRGWRIALTGAEPVRPATIRAFTSRFAAAGLRPTALTPAYGLAESTLFVRAGDPTLPARGARYEREALGRGTARLVAPPSAGVVAGPGGTGASVELVSCGRACEGIELAVVDVDGPRPTRCAPDRVGEVWVRSASNGRGYWRQPAASRETFEAVLDGTGPWLRTGDLGFLDRNGELVVTGRRKDLMIIRGVNHYPQDFEQMVQSAHPALGSGLAAAFTDPEDEERVVVVVEAAAGDQDRELVEAAAAAARSVTAHLPVPTDVVVVSRATVPRTTSGKVRRAECAQRYGAHVLPELARWPRRVA